MSIYSIITLYTGAFISVSCIICNVPCTNCDQPYGCVNQALNDDSVYSTAYKAASGAGTSIYSTYSTFCRASFSCESISSIQVGDQQEIVCEGTHSCTNTTILSNTMRQIYCWGANSCMFTDISSTNINEFELECGGYGSCAYSHIHSIQTISAKGSYSLYKSIIDTENSNNTDIVLSGEYAGYGATIKCRKDHQCNIYCNAYNSCYKLFVDCIGNCIFYNKSESTILPITNIASIGPIEWFSQHNVFDFALNNDKECNTANSVVFDSSEPTKVDIIITDNTTGSLCCRALHSCSSIDRIEYQITTKRNIICSALYACSESNIISNNGSVFCSAGWSCTRSQITGASFIYCMGRQSCSSLIPNYYAVLNNSRHILCGGLFSCLDAVITSGGTDLSIYFNGQTSGMRAQVNCNIGDLCEIICSGAFSCYETTLICQGICTVKCNAESDCPIGWTSSPTTEPTPAPTDLTSNPTYPPTQFTTSMTTDTVVQVTQSVLSVSIINITLNIDDVAVNNVIQTVNETLIAYLIATGHSFSLQSDIIENENGAIITAYVGWNGLQSDVINKHEIEREIVDDLDAQFDNNVALINIDVINTKPHTKSETSNNTAAIVFSVLLISILVINIVVWYYNDRRSKKRIFQVSAKNISDNTVVVENDDAEYIEDDVKDIVPGTDQVIQNTNVIDPETVCTDAMGDDDVIEGDKEQTETNQMPQTAEVLLDEFEGGVDTVDYNTVARTGLTGKDEGSDHSDDSDRMYVQDNLDVEAKIQNSNDNEHITTTGSDKEEKEEPLQQKTKGDVYYDKHYDKIWDSEVNK